MTETKGIRCPKCSNSETTVVDSRPTQRAGIRRRRECESCGERFTTVEQIPGGQETVMFKFEDLKKLLEKGKTK